MRWHTDTGWDDLVQWDIWHSHFCLCRPTDSNSHTNSPDLIIALEWNKVIDGRHTETENANWPKTKQIPGRRCGALCGRLADICTCDSWSANLIFHIFVPKRLLNFLHFDRVSALLHSGIFIWLFDSIQLAVFSVHCSAHKFERCVLAKIKLNW